MNYLTIFNSYYSVCEDDIPKQLLLYHSFKQTPPTLNEKLSFIGVIQGMWNFTSNFNTIEDIKWMEINLQHENIITLKIEDEYFGCLSFENEDDCDSRYYLYQLYQCYQFFKLQFGTFKSFKECSTLTDRLNEYFIEFWDHVQLIPQIKSIKGFQDLWIKNCKMSELEFIEDSKWESMLKSYVLLDSKVYLGLKDICIYNMSKYDSNFKKYGLIRNFTTGFRSLPILSNWIYHTALVFGNLSSHALASNIHYQQDIGSEDNILNEEVEENDFYSITNHALHNLSLPISFVYDAITEVSNMTGVSSSMTGLMNSVSNLTKKIVPKSYGLVSENPTKDYGFLISPLNPHYLSNKYHYRLFYLNFDGYFKWYKVLFWHFNEIIIVLVFEDTFDKIWEKDLLVNLNLHLHEIMCKLESETINNTPFQNFNYYLLDKNTNELWCSFPLVPCDEPNSLNPLKLVIDGIDETLQFLVPKAEKTQMSKNKKTFLDKLDREKLVELNSNLSMILKSMNNSNKKDQIKEEKLIKLNNGIICYLENSTSRTILVVKNWLDINSNDKLYEDGKLIESMGKDVFQWWETIEQKLNR